MFDKIINKLKRQPVDEDLLEIKDHLPLLFSVDSIEQLYNYKSYCRDTDRFSDLLQGILVYVNNSKRIYFIKDDQLIPINQKFTPVEFKCEKCGTKLKTSEVSRIVFCKKCNIVYDLDKAEDDFKDSFDNLFSSIFGYNTDHTEEG